jgi:hypothetical protein
MMMYQHPNILRSSIRKSNRYHDSFDDLDAWDNNIDNTDTDSDQFKDARRSTADNILEDDQESIFASSRPPGTSLSAQTKRTKTFHRAGTPVMNNNSKQKKNATTTMNSMIRARMMHHHHYPVYVHCHHFLQRVFSTVDVQRNS